MCRYLSADYALLVEVDDRVWGMFKQNPHHTDSAVATCSMEDTDARAGRHSLMEYGHIILMFGISPLSISLRNRSDPFISVLC